MVSSYSVTSKYKRHLSSGFGHLHPRGFQRAAMNDTKMNVRSTAWTIVASGRISESVTCVSILKFGPRAGS